MRYIRAEYGDYFGLTVAGYPEAHPDVIKSDPEEQKKARAAPRSLPRNAAPLTQLRAPGVCRRPGVSEAEGGCRRVRWLLRCWWQSQLTLRPRLLS